MKKSVMTLAAVFLVLSVFIFQGQGFSEETDEALAAKPVSTLIRETEATQDHRVKSRLIEALKKKTLQSPEDIKAVVDAVDSADLDLQEFAILHVMNARVMSAAGKLRGKVMSLPIGKVDVRSEKDEKAIMNKVLSAQALSAMKDKNALPIMIDKLSGLIGPTGYERELGASIVGYGADALPKVEKKLEELGRTNAHGRLEMLAVISNMNDKGAESDLRRLSESDDLDIRTAAVRGLRNIGVKTDITKIIKAIKDIEDNPKKRKDWEQHGDLTEELGFSGNTDAIPYLKQKIENELKKGSSGYSELVALARFGGQDIFQYILGIYQGKYPGAEKNSARKQNDIRHTVLSAFTKAHMQEAVPFLTELMEDKTADKELRLSAVTGLREITGDNAKYVRIYMQIERGQR
ncbi:MAG: HEAT repeat domain-containing protein [Deltaproteobacteria bacterium]|nr:HEAT repeat domain-containing protein [Deltaproteobacteria bacterium]